MSTTSADRGAGRPTLDAVAARAGVGRGTVSRVVNGASGVSPRAREAVERAIAELGYVPNRAARSLVTSRADAIALIIPETETRLASEPFFGSVIRGVAAELSDTDMQLLLILVSTERERRRLAGFLDGRRVDGALLVSVHADDPVVELLEQSGLPTVLGGRRFELEPLSYVNPDNLGGAWSAVRHLLGRGRQRVATITGPLDMETSCVRLEGYRRALAEADVAALDTLIAHGDFSEDSGEQAMAQLLEREPDLDAVFCASDLMAAGAMRTLRRAGRRIPADVAVVGFDDSPVARHTEPPMTSVRQPTEEMGREMARLLLEEIASPGRSHRQVILSTELVVRESA
ncbi:LacI family DNA-binding transcriptional regulator [Streptacidiphilus fuscans]|uniref:LacI family DNA-binding transcriptional regulator n=1 Tax=Streptacidiphilus fuscans TaxID=2789292 RepID=A0A931AXH2_9ACTN|nr:LacI family DNA-binding transcriptional regulator [Streptacidiphilus fuscans]MBF9067199.1 LacI family DNA-binding transcriptional regulator [Streptacidiphilus fuscans]